MPAFLLKRQIMTNLPTEKLEVSVANSIDFMVERVRTHLLVSCSIVCIVLNRLHSLNNKDNTVGFLIGGGGVCTMHVHWGLYVHSLTKSKMWHCLLPFTAGLAHS